MTAPGTLYDIALIGCRPEPLSSYLKALGVLRLVGEQRDREARGFWRGEAFVLRSTLDAQALTRFFLHEWEPTPVVAPWNGGSGFFPKDNRSAADRILASNNPRLKTYAISIEIARDFIEERGWNQRPVDEEKLLTLAAMRARLPDPALVWLDAAVVIADDRLLFPPLLGTGGNDGRLDFSNNFQQRVIEVLSGEDESALLASLFGVASRSAFKGVMGQYHPAAGERTNPWDFVLLIEGALTFAAAVTRRHERSSGGVMAFPFHARAAGGAATVTDSDESESRDELWLPLWSAPATSRAVRRLFAEGRAVVGVGDAARPAASSLDFARAVAALGVDRGVDGFIRVGFHVRNGLAYYATPLGRFGTRAVPGVRCLDEIDAWYAQLRSRKNLPAAVAAARRRLEQAMFSATTGVGLGPVLLALGDMELALARSLSFTNKERLRPVPPLSRAWAEDAHDGSVEQRLAAALAARQGIRARLLPLDPSGRGFGRGDEADWIFRDRPLIENLLAVLRYEDIEASQQTTAGLPAELSSARCSLTDVARFIDVTVDDMLIDRWLRALTLVRGIAAFDVPRHSVRPPAAFAVLALVHNRRIGDDDLPRTPAALTAACAGRAIDATRSAIRRLNAIGGRVPVSEIFEPTPRTRRIAAALAFPLSSLQRQTLEGMVLSGADAPLTTRTGMSQEELA